MTARPVPPVIPGSSRDHRRAGKPGAGRPMPLASPPGRPDVVYGFGRIDASGRVADRATIAALGWRGGDPLTLTADAGVMIARRDPGGRGAAEHLIAALRCMYKYAVADGILTERENPAARVPKPRRLQSTRRALPEGRLEEILRVAATTGDDPALDALLLRLHIETACRRGGALALMPEDLDAEQCLIQLREKARRYAGSPFHPP
jgi:integrase